MTEPSPRIPRSFFDRPTLEVACDLLGKRLVKLEPAGRLSGIINEVEAYIGAEDLACHARFGKTNRNRVMWGPPGFAYIYFTYGMHWLLNFVTERDHFAAAVLLRSLVAEEGVETMLQRRKGRHKNLTNGPAKVCQAFGLTGKGNALDLCSPRSTLFVENGIKVGPETIKATPRIGIDSVPEPWKSIPWRFTCQV
jgi:DNA-3-methyladenine glycosylase